MSVNKDYKDLFSILNKGKVRYLVVGAYAVIYYSEPRYTKDVDIWIEPTLNNARKVWQALSEFGAPLKGVTVEDFCNPHTIFQIGIEPNRIDIIMGIAGLSFESAWQNKTKSKYGNTWINILGIKDLIRSKRTANRPKDIIDVQTLEKI